MSEDFSLARLSKFSGRMIGAWDYITGEDHSNGLTKENAVKSMKFMSGNGSLDQRHIFRTIMTDYPGIAIDILSDMQGNINPVFAGKLYDQEIREIKAAKIFDKVMKDSKTDVFTLGEKYNLNPETILAWCDLRKHTPWFLVTAIEHLEKTNGGNWTPGAAIEAWFKYRNGIVSNYYLQITNYYLQKEQKND